MKQLNTRAFWQYYRTTIAINVMFSALMALFSLKAFWFPIQFTTFGILAGVLFFNYYYKQQYYFYHNLGYTRKQLVLNTFTINLPIAILLLALITLI